MARVTVEDCVQRVSNRFELVMLAAQRARNIGAGAPLTVDLDNDKNPVVALREIAEGSVGLNELENNLVQSLQKVVELEEPGEDDVDLLSLRQDVSVDRPEPGASEATDEAAEDVDEERAELASDETASDETAPGETASDASAADETAPDETAPDETASDEMAAEEMAPEEMAPEEMAPEEMAPEEMADEDRDQSGPGQSGDAPQFDPDRDSSA